MLEKLNRLTIPLGEWFGVPVFIHWSWWMFGLFIAISNPTFVPIFLGIFGIILLHEFGHIFAAKHFRWNVHNVTLYPIGGVASLHPSPDPWEEFVVAISGPAVNVVLLTPFHFLSPYGSFGMIAAINIVILVFNLLPIFPMDGGRIFRSVLQGVTKNRKWSTLIAVRVGQGLCVIMGVVALYFWHVVLFAIAVLIALAAEAELNMVQSGVEEEINSGDEVGRSADMVDEIQRRIDRYRNDFDR